MSSIRCDIYDRDEWGIWFAAAPYGAASKPAKTLKTWAAEEQADVVYNLCLFNMTGTGSDQYGVIKGRTLQYLRAKDVDCGYGGTAERLTVSPGNVVAGVKVAVRDGVVLSGLDKSTYRSRNMIGELADGRIIVVQSSDGCTEEQVARYAAGRYTIDLLLVQDAGGSTGMYRAEDGYLFAPEKEGTDGRPVCSVVCMRKKVKEEKDPMFKIALGAGHGINTAGKRCLKSLDPNETREWWLNDRICDKVEALLKGYDGYALLRLDDSDDGAEDVALATRTTKANDWGADFYLSVHHNAGANGTAAGGIVAFSYPGSSAGAAWRDAFYDALIRHTGLKGNRSEPKTTANFYVLRCTTMPAVLLECGFMDSTTDVPVILTEAFADQCAAAIVEVLAARGGLTKKAADEPEDEPDDAFETDEEVQAAITRVQQKAGLAAETMQYLLAYEYGTDLVLKLAKAME